MTPNDHCLPMARPGHTIVIVGAGFSGTALAWRLLRDPPPGRCRVVLVERAPRFGPGLAHAGQLPGALLNVPAGRMSLDERIPDDFLAWLRARNVQAGAHDFVPRGRYGDYLESRLAEAAMTCPERVRLVRVRGCARRLVRARDDTWAVALEDGRSIAADAVVLATGHPPPRNPAALQSLVGHGRYVAEPWSTTPAWAPARVLLVGTGLTMADFAQHLLRQPRPPLEVVAVSRRGLLPRARREVESPCRSSREVAGVLRRNSTRALVAGVRDLVARTASTGGDWRDVIAGVREQAPAAWARLDTRERARLLRHVQPYWDVHRHPWPAATERAVRGWIDDGRLRVLPARIVAARESRDQVLVDLLPRGAGEAQTEAFDLVVNCTGPDTDLRRADSALLRSLLAEGYLTPDPNGLGALVDDAGRLVGRDGRCVPGLHCLGPWLKARDFEATAVPELRALATRLASDLRAAVDPPRTVDLSRLPAAARFAR